MEFVYPQGILSLHPSQKRYAALKPLIHVSQGYEVNPGGRQPETEKYMLRSTYHPLIQ